MLTSASAALAQQPAASPAPAMAAHGAPAADVATPEPRLILLDDVKTRLESNTKMIILDVRGAISGEVAKGSLHVPMDKLDAWSKDVAKDALIVAYCACGSEGTSKAAVRRLQELGFTNAFALKGGIQGWQSAGMPTETFKP
jgi:rhodanese-related sulfurtransferase